MLLRDIYKNVIFGRANEEVMLDVFAETFPKF